MSEFEKASILHALQNNFNITTDELQKLLDQIRDDNVRNNYARIQRGLTTEDNYRAIFSALPWVKNINGIHQEQEKHHKEKYQTPDYSLLIEDSERKNFPILVDVKTVSGHKESCEIIPKQMHALRAYARDHRTPLLFAIYWERLGYWTHTSFMNFGGKKNNKITWKEAIRNDLSHILSDYSFLIDGKFYRKTTFSKRKSSTAVAGSEKDGYFSEIFVGRNLDNLKSYNIITSSAIDAIFNANKVSKTEIDESCTLVIEEFNQPRIVKISNWLVNFVNLWKVPTTERIGDTRITTEGRVAMVELMKDLNFKTTYLIPSNKNSETEKFFKLAYEGTIVMNDYYAQNK